MNEVSGYFGTLGLSAAMTLVMLIVYRFFPENTSDRLKTAIVVFLGILLAVIHQLYIGKSFGFVCMVDCFFYGVELGAGSIGLFKIGQAAGVFKGMKGGG